MKLGSALVRRRELIVKKNALETRLVEAHNFKVHIETGKELDQIYSSGEFANMLADINNLRIEIESLKKSIVKANQIVLDGACVQDLVIEVGSQKDLLSLLAKLRAGCKGGESMRYFRSEEGVVMKTIMSAVELDILTDAAQARVDALNHKITQMNAQIEV